MPSNRSNIRPRPPLPKCRPRPIGPIARWSKARGRCHPRKLVIVLDPGHGGSYRGAMGPGGTASGRESPSLSSGASCRMPGPRYISRARWIGTWSAAPLTPPFARCRTRDADRRRVRRAAALVSAGFAAVGSRRPSRTRQCALTDLSSRFITTPMPAVTDPQSDPDLLPARRCVVADAARAIHRHLMRNLGTRREVRPGNYHVLRTARSPPCSASPPSGPTQPSRPSSGGSIASS